MRVNLTKNPSTRDLDPIRYAGGGQRADYVNEAGTGHEPGPYLSIEQGIGFIPLRLKPRARGDRCGGFRLNVRPVYTLTLPGRAALDERAPRVGLGWFVCVARLCFGPAMGSESFRPCWAIFSDAASAPDDCGAPPVLGRGGGVLHQQPRLSVSFIVDTGEGNPARFR